MRVEKKIIKKIGGAAFHARLVIVSVSIEAAGHETGSGQFHNLLEIRQFCGV